MMNFLLAWRMIWIGIVAARMCVVVLPVMAEGRIGGSAADSDSESIQIGPRKIGETHQLFLDDQLIESIDGLKRIVNPPVRYHGNPVLTWDQPWEGNCVIAWGSVVYDHEAQMFKAWYQVYKKFPAAGQRQSLVCYATSVDGLQWHKPQVGRFTYDGSRENNIVFLGDGAELDSATVFLDPHPTPAVKYRMYWCDAACVRQPPEMESSGMWLPEFELQPVTGRRPATIQGGRSIT